MDHSDLLTAISEGFFLGISLIAAIGPQNFFVIRQGIIGRHLFMVAGISALCDFALICIGTMGVGSIISDIFWLRQTAAMCGVIFLSYYAFKSFYNAIKGESFLLTATADGVAMHQRTIILSALGFSLFNPHAILDTVILIGGLSAQFPSTFSRVSFAIGAGAASVIWFFSLTYGARFFAPYFRSPYFATIVDVLIGSIMCWIGLSLFLKEIL